MAISRIFVTLILIFFLTFTSGKEQLNVFIIPQSHCDVGWLLTKEEYFERAVRKIITSVFETLLKHKDRKFIWVET